jgi:DNA-binding NarL/FixJ family response regulator
VREPRWRFGYPSVMPMGHDDVMIRVVLVDDHPVVRAGIRALLEGQEDLTVAGEASDASGAVEVVQSTHPDVVLMDPSC